MMILSIGIRGSVCFLLLSGLLSLNFSGCAKPPASLAQGQAYMESGNWDKSVQYFQKAAEEDPSDAQIKLQLLRCKWEASLAHMAIGEKLFKNKLYDEAAKSFRISLAFNPGNLKAVEWIRKVKATQKAEIAFTKGQQFLSKGELQPASDALLNVLKLDPANQKAKELLEQIESERRNPFDRLALKSKEPISLKFKKTPIMDVFEMLSRLTGINFIFDKEVIDNKVSLFMSDVSFGRFIEMLLQTNQLKANIVDEKTVLIYPDSAAKRKDYEEMQIRTIFLVNLEAKKAKVLLSHILKSRAISINETFNSIVIRGTADVVELAERVIQANDRPAAEVVLNVDILEVNRVKEKQLGLEVNPASIGFGIGETSPEIDKYSVYSPFASAYALNHFSSKELLFSVPTATLHLLKQDGDTKTLANPQIRARNNEKATIHIGERVPLRTNRRIDTNGNVTSDFQYQDIGVKLEAVPSININDEISLKLTLEVSSLGQNVGTVDEPQYSIKTRMAKSVVTVLDGEAVIVGGLINDEERETMRQVPFIGQLPLIGRLFTSQGDSTTKTDILMSITPVVIRSQEYPGYSATHIWSGSENQMSTQRLFRSIQNAPQKNNAPHALSGDDRQSLLGDPQTDNSNMPQIGLSGGTDADSRQNNTSSIESGAKPVEEAYPENSELPAKSEPVTDQKYCWDATIPYSIHVNSYPERSLAQQRLHELSALNYICHMVYAHVPQKGGFYRIFVGNYPDFKTAQKACRELKMETGFAEDIHVADRKWSLGG